VTAILNLEHDAIAASFDELRLRPATLQALSRMGIVTPTPIQGRALPALLAGRDVIGQARTGSGKTLAFGIPIVEMVDPAVRSVQALVLTPTRELAVQVGGVLDELGASRGVNSTLIFGGRAAGPQIAALRRGAPIVVGTPGRVLDLLNQGALDLAGVRFLVLDEADEMLDRGFAPDVERILGRTPRARQTALFSATVPAWVDGTARAHLTDPVRVMVDPDPEDAAPIDHIAFDVANGDKLGALRELLDRRGAGSIIVFGRTKHGVKKLAKRLEADGYPVGALQGNLSQNARDRVMADFRAGRVRILLATNVAARGLDIDDVDQVINVELPESPELLTHRVGRTGRMGRAGQAITLLAPDDAPKWRELERGLGRRIQRAPWPGAAAAGVIQGVEPARTVDDAQPRRGLASPPTATRPERRPGPIGPMAPRRDALPPAVRAEAPTSRPPRRDDDRRRRPRSGRSQVVCSGCGQAAEVPFQPDPARPVYCSTCFSARRKTGARAGGGWSSRA
jgi:ATP-dependent RNA helicase DeaD